MDYNDMYNQISYLKKNRNKIELTERLKKIIAIIGEHPDALHLFENWFLDSNQVKQLENHRINHVALTQSILTGCKITTSNSCDLTYKFYGYCKTITPDSLDQLIDEVATRIQLEREYAMVAGRIPYVDQQEDELTLGELIR